VATMAPSSNATRKKVTLRGGTHIHDRAPSDTVPAWLTPHEFVEPVESAKMFGPLLEAMRQAGLAKRHRGDGASVTGGMSAGGPVCPMCGQSCGVPATAEGHSLGGWVKAALDAASLIPGPQQTFVKGAAIVGNGLIPSDQQPQSGADAYQRIREREMQGQGYADGGSVSPYPAQNTQTASDSPAPIAPAAPQPYQWGAPTSTLLDPTRGAFGDLGHLIQGFGAAGYYDPNGSPGALDAMRQKAVEDAQEYSNQAALGADVSGLDPGAASALRLTARANAGRGIGEGLVNYQAQDAAQREAFARDAFMRNFGEASTQLGRYQDYSNMFHLPRH